MFRQILLVSIVALSSAYVSLLDTGINLHPLRSFEPYQFRSFDRIKDPNFYRFRYGFPAGIYGSSVIPTTIWFFHWSDADYHRELVRIPNFNTMLPVAVDWLLIVRSCDEIKFPRCSWAHFINFVQPVQFDLELLQLSGTAGGVYDETDMLPYIHGNCWPIKSVEQASIIYVYAVCTVYWDVPGFDKELCPRPCSQTPCAILPFARAGSCKPLGIHEKDFECSCAEGFSWDPNTFACIPESRCELFCHPTRTATCIQDPKSSSMICVCQLGYMGHDCSQLLDACLVGSEVYDSVEAGIAKPVVPPGWKACGMDNKCVPQLGTPSFSCQCSDRYTMDRGLSYDNCNQVKDPCSSRLCIEGTCIATEDGTKSKCDCEGGYAGPQCEIALGSWTPWTEWSLCEPYCGDQRLRRRIRVCSGDRQEDCLGSVEQVESCPDAEPCPLARNPEEVEWEDFAEWFCILLGVSVIYAALLLLLLTLYSFLRPSGKVSTTTGHAAHCRNTLRAIGSFHLSGLAYRECN